MGKVGERKVNPSDFDFRAPNADAIAKASGDRKKEASRMPAHPSSTGGGKVMPHLGDLSQFQTEPQFNLHIRNETGANINRSVAQLGLSSGNFNT